MIEFDLTEDHLSAERLVREFVSKEVTPVIAENDANHYFDRSLLSKLAELGLLGICIPTQYGGAGFDYISLGLASEELEYGDTSLRVIMSVHVGLNCLTLLSWGTEDQKQRYLVPQARGEKIASYGLTEPDAGSDVVGIQTTARREGNEYILNGEKVWISFSRCCR
jgi:glutaryl-CoA dehydrogenase (non-decarboxylating)